MTQVRAPKHAARSTAHPVPPTTPPVAGPPPKDGAGAPFPDRAAAEEGDARPPGFDLLAAARSGDQAAFAALYRTTQPRLLRYAATLVGQDADDVTAEAWLQIARDLKGFTGDQMAFRGWAAVVVRNRSLDHLRAQARRPVSPSLDALLDGPSDLDTAQQAIERVTTADALALIATLPADQAEAVLLRTVVGLDGPTAATVLGKRPGAVRVATHRGLKALGRLLDRAADGGE